MNVARVSELLARCHDAGVGYSHTPDLEVVTAHDDLIMSEEHRVPVLHHRIVLQRRIRRRTRVGIRCNRTFSSVQHGRNDTSQHVDGVQADFLVLVDLAKLGDADRQVGKRAVNDDFAKVIGVELLHQFERVASHSFCQGAKGEIRD